MQNTKNDALCVLVKLVRKANGRTASLADGLLSVTSTALAGTLLSSQSLPHEMDLSDDGQEVGYVGRYRRRPTNESMADWYKRRMSQS